MRNSPIIINPGATTIGQKNLVLTGTARQYHVADFAGSLSIKATLNGSSQWALASRRFLVNEGTYLVVNDGQPYTIEIESATPVTTFCLFFARNFLEEIVQAMTCPERDFVDDPYAVGGTLRPFKNLLQPRGNRVFEQLRAFAARVYAGDANESWDDSFVEIGVTAAREHHHCHAQAKQLSALRASTRAEVYRRLLQGRDYLVSGETAVSLNEVARVAGLSPFHFHRSFRAVFGETPYRFLVDQRLRRAAALLTQTEMTVTEVCLECGFSSLPSFSRLFKHWAGRGPQDFRSAKGKLARIDKKPVSPHR